MVPSVVWVCFVAELIPGPKISYHTSTTALIKINSCHDCCTTCPRHFDFIRSVKIVLLKSVGGLWKRGLWGSPPQCPTEIKPSLQNKRHRLKRKQRGARRNPCISLFPFLGRRSHRLGFKVKCVAVRKRVIRRSQRPSFLVCLTFLLLSASPRPISHSAPMGHFL